MSPTISALAWALIHFLWEGTLIAAALALALRITKPSSANIRYLISCCAMVVMLASTAGTFAWLNEKAGSAEQAAPLVLGRTFDLTAAMPAAGGEPQKRTQFGAYLPWLVYLWMGGVFALSLRTGAGFIVAQRLKCRQASPLPPLWEGRFRRLAERLQITRTVRACESALTDVPAVVGWLRPVVLVPASALTGLPAPDVEALLAHELAHIRRNDYLVNLLQTAVETLLFYHPAVWWTGQQIRAERENCCDDLAVEMCGDVLTYARALTRLEQMRSGAPAMAMAANRGSLLGRIRRLVRPDESTKRVPGDWVTGVAILLSVTAIYAAGYVPLPNAMAVKESNTTETRPRVVLAAAQKPTPAGPRVDDPVEAQVKNTVEENLDITELEQRIESLKDLSQLDQNALGKADELSRLAHRLAQQIHEGAIESIKASELAQMTRSLALLEAQAGQTDPSQAASPGFVEGLKAEGFNDLSVDDLIAFKTHGVSPDFIRRIKAAGFQPTPDELVSLRIHGVDVEQIAGYKAAGVDKLTIDDLVSLRIHGATPEFVSSIRAAGYPRMDADDIVALRIHGVTPEFAGEIKTLGLGDPTLDDLVSLRIHGVTSEFAREVKALKLRELDLDGLEEMRIHGITPVFIRDAQKRGFKDLSVEQVVRLKQLNILNN